MKKLAILAIAGLISTISNASDWWLYGESELSNSYIDMDSISNSSGYRGAFIRHDLKKYGQAGSKQYDTVILFQQVDCKANPRKSRRLSSIFKNGIQTVATINTPSDWDVVYPDTISEISSLMICLE